MRALFTQTEIDVENNVIKKQVVIVITVYIPTGTLESLNINEKVHFCVRLFRYNCERTLNAWSHQANANGVNKP